MGIRLHARTPTPTHTNAHWQSYLYGPVVGLIALILIATVCWLGAQVRVWGLETLELVHVLRQACLPCLSVVHVEGVGQTFVGLGPTVFFAMRNVYSFANQSSV